MSRIYAKTNKNFRNKKEMFVFFGACSIFIVIQFSSPVSKIRNRWQYILCARERINEQDEEEKRASQSFFSLSPWSFLSVLRLYTQLVIFETPTLACCSYYLTKKKNMRLFSILFCHTFFFPFISFIYFCLLIKPNLHNKKNSSSNNNNNKAPKAKCSCYIFRLNSDFIIFFEFCHS